MHLHSDRYEYVRRLYQTAQKMLREDTPIPCDFEATLVGCGINVEAMREQEDFIRNQLGFAFEPLNGSLTRD